jgi:alpha-L-fucosidase
MIIRNLIASILIITSLGVNAQLKYEPAPENLKNREWFQNAKFGMFIHWGVYSVLGDGEWVMNMQQIPLKQYEKLPTFFNPTEFDPKQWVQMAKDAGMKYIVFTTKHHDGFAMWNSKLTDYNIVKGSPYGKDIFKMLADACHEAGIKLFAYHSQLDWHHPDYYPRGKTSGDWAGRPNEGDMNKYLDYMDGQLTEILTNYGEISGVWFDGMWDKPDTDWRLSKTYQLIHDLQPGALVGSNHHRAPYPGEDFQMFEKDLPGHNTAGFSTDKAIGTLPKEVCETINHSWGFHLKDNQHKSKKQLVQYIVKGAGHDANFLLNVGPMPNGKIQDEHVAVLKEVGEWTKKFGESVYETRGGPLTPRHWGVTTQRGNKVYVHILDWADESIVLPSWGKKIKSASLLADGSAVKFQENEFGVTLRIPKNKLDDIDTIIVLETK